MTEAKELADPECPAERWWQLARYYPLEAQASILYPLLTLEDPARWLRLECENISEWIIATKENLSTNLIEKHKTAVSEWELRVIPYPGAWLEYKRFQWRLALDLQKENIDAKDR